MASNRRYRYAASSSSPTDQSEPAVDETIVKKEIKKEFEESELDPELDPESALFNPLKALYAENLPSCLLVKTEQTETEPAPNQCYDAASTSTASSLFLDSSSSVPGRSCQNQKYSSSRDRESLKGQQYRYQTSINLKTEIKEKFLLKRDIKEETIDRSYLDSTAVSSSISSRRPDTHKNLDGDVTVIKRTDGNSLTQSYDIKQRQRSSSFSHSDIVAISTSKSSQNEFKTPIQSSHSGLCDLQKSNNRQSRWDTSKDLTRSQHGHYSRSASASLRGACSSQRSETGDFISNHPQSLDAQFSKMPPVVRSETQEPAQHQQIKGRHDKQTTDSHPNKIKAKKNVLNQMSEFVGPMSILKRAVQDKLQVRVMTRQAVDTRAICKGYIVAFDKYMNMAMIDVDEIYRRPKILGKIKSKRSHKLKAAQPSLLLEKEELNTLREGIANNNNQNALQQPATSNIIVDKMIDIKASPSSVEIPKKKRDGISLERQLRKMKSIYPDLPAALSPFEREALLLGVPDENVEIRHLNQLFIRGENIVLVNIVEDF